MEIWSNPGSWTQLQWLAFAILVFVIIAIIVLLFRLYHVVQMLGRKPERPDLRVGRRLGRKDLNKKT